MFWETLKIRWYAISGKYGTGAPPAVVPS
jgi:hypothetical protein